MQLNIEASNAEERELIDSRIVAFNNSKVPFTQEEPFVNLSYIIRNEGEVVAGINALMYSWKCLYVDILWVDEAHRKDGYGSALLNKVESEAKNSGSHLVHLDTFDFQTKDFYIKHGYEIFGTLEDCPLPGRKRYYLKKNL